MESLRRSHAAAASAAKMTNVNGLSKNAYDDVFASPRKKLGASKLGSGGVVEDYDEIFGGSRVSSIPTLDLSALEETAVSDDVLSSKVDYLNVFGGFKEVEIGVSHEQLLAAAKRGKTVSGKARNLAETGSPLQPSSSVNCPGENQVFSSEASSQMLNGSKQFNMSYHKTGQRSKDGTNGTTRIAQLHAVPGFTCFIDEVTPQQTNVDKPRPSVINEVPHTGTLKEKTVSQDRSRKDVSPCTKKQSSEGVIRSRSGSRCEGSFSDNDFFNAHEINFFPPSKFKTSSCQSVGLDNKKNSSKSLAPSNFGPLKNNASGDCSSPFSDEELDINSNAAASIAALRKALQQAEESIRLAKESMERKNNGLQGFPNQRFNDSLNIKGTRKGRNAQEDNRIKEKNAEETLGRVHPVVQVNDGANGTKAFRTFGTAANFRDSQKLSTSANVVGEALEAYLKPAQECDAAPAMTEKHKIEASSSDQVGCRIGTLQTIGKDEFQVMEKKTPTETLDQQECIAGNVEIDEYTCMVKNNMEESPSAVKIVEQCSEDVNELESSYFVHEDEGTSDGGIAQKCREKEERLGGFCEPENSEKKVEVLQEKAVESIFELPDLKENEDENCQNEAEELEEDEGEPEATEKEQIEEEIDAHEKALNETIYHEEEIEKSVKIFEDHVGGSNGDIPIISIDYEGMRLKEAWQKIYNVITTKEAGCESAERTQLKFHEREETEQSSEYTPKLEIDMKSSNNTQDAEGGGERPLKQYGLEGEEMFEDGERLPRQTHHSTDNKKVEVTADTICKIVFDTFSDVGMDDKSENISKVEEVCRDKIYSRNMESGQDIGSQETGIITESPRPFSEVSEDKEEAAAGRMALRLKEFKILNASGSVQGAGEDNEIENQRQDASAATRENTENSNGMDIRRQKIEQNDKQPELAPNFERGSDFLIDGYGENGEDVKESNAIDKEEVVKGNSETVSEEGHWVEVRKKSEASRHYNLSIGEVMEVDSPPETRHTSPSTESNEENLPKTMTLADKEVEENVEKEADEECCREVKEAYRKRREWEKDRIAVERAIREAREGAFAEACERAEQAAVERVNAEVRQRVSTKAREKLEKASAGTKHSDDKVSIQAKLRNISEVQEVSRDKICSRNMESGQDIGSQENGIIAESPKPFSEVSEDKEEAGAAIMALRLKEFKILNASGSVQGAGEDDEIENQRQDTSAATRENTGNSNGMDIRRQKIEQNDKQPELAPNFDRGSDFLIDGYGENGEDVKESNAIDKEEAVKGNSEMVSEEGHWVEVRKKSEASRHYNLSNGKVMEVDSPPETRNTSPSTESNEENLPKTMTLADKEVEENVVKEADEECRREVKEAYRKRREWEKDRIAVERAIREAREGAFAEACERAEQAAVESANAEVRQRVLTKAQEKLEKASAGTKHSDDKVSIKAKLRNISEVQEVCRDKICSRNMESGQDIGSQENGIIAESPTPFSEVSEDKEEVAAAIMAIRLKEFKILNASGSVQGAGEDDEIENQRQDASDATHENIGNSNGMDVRRQKIEQNEKQPELAPNIERDSDFLIDGNGENVEDVKESNASDEEVVKGNPETVSEEGHWVEEGKKSEASQHYNLSNGEEMEVDSPPETSQTSPSTESNEENLPKTATMADKEVEENVEKEADEERRREVKEAYRKRREWDKDRIAVERAIREARERAFAEACERAERAAVERANAEVRQRVLTKARGKLEKASAGTKHSADKVSIQAKLRAERAAVERATAEARERALEKALSQKASSGARIQVGDKLSGASQDNGMKHTLASSNFDKSDGAVNESAQRRKARLERHQRVMERAAKALAEKNKRDLLAQKEQAERNRLAEVLDADIKRWASGKEGNLRALLSTLQYILGPDGGWQPISLTDIITTNAVKKAYRKATLYVHPDKLQQRGASIQQKYTCEKVFDLLQAAWNRFNPEER